MLGAYACKRGVCVEDVRLEVLSLHWPNTIRKCLDSGLMCCIWPAKAEIGEYNVVIDLMNVQRSRSRAPAKYKQKESDSLRAC